MGEEIVIGDNIKLVVSRIAGNRVTIGINAPGNVTILRGELDHAGENEAGSLVDTSTSLGRFQS
jgi:carbon storage regulator CsrA